jgi:hypothetical protein
VIKQTDLNLAGTLYKMTKKIKNIASLNLELWNDFFAKNIPKTPKNELWQAPNIQ